MRLSAIPLLNYANINSFSFANQWIVRAGDPNTLYFQLTDMDKGPSNSIGNPVFGSSPTLGASVGLRYIVGVGSQNQPVNITVTFPSIDDTKTIVLTAFQADPNDGSIWAVTIGPAQTPGSGNVLFSVTEGNSTRKFSVLNLISVEYISDGSC